MSASFARPPDEVIEADVAAALAEDIGGGDATASLLDDAPGGLLPAPWILQWLSRFLWFRHLPARLFGYGVRRECVTFPRSH